MLNLNRIAYLASYYGEGDPVYADKIFPRIGKQWDEDTWRKKETFEDMKQWASAVAPAAAQVRVMEEAAEANERTPEGARYKAAFEKTYRELLEKCVVTDGGSVTEWEGKFKTLILLAANGRVEKFGILSMGPVVTCLAHKMQSFEQENASPFPPPPRGSYWVALNLDWAEFAKVATK